MFLRRHYTSHVLCLSSEMYFVLWCVGRCIQLMVARDPEYIFEVLLGNLESFVKSLERLTHFYASVLYILPLPRRYAPSPAKIKPSSAPRGLSFSNSSLLLL